MGPGVLRCNNYLQSSVQLCTYPSNEHMFEWFSVLGLLNGRETILATTVIAQAKYDIIYITFALGHTVTSS
jgi:hypothetical protein